MNRLKVVLFSVGVVLVALCCILLPSREISEEYEQPAEMSLEHPFFACAACHGVEGEGNELLFAPRLAGQRPEYLRLQVESFRNEWRGADIPGQLMANAIRALDQETIDEAIAYVGALLPEQVVQSKVNGNMRHGEYLYQRSCAVCHGKVGEGSMIEADVPRLDIQYTWYLERQLNQYRNKQRGFNPDDTLGNVMGFYAQLLPDEQAVRDVVLWLAQAPESLDEAEGEGRIF